MKKQCATFNAKKFIKWNLDGMSFYEQCQLAELGFKTKQEGFYIRKIGNIEIWVRKEILITQDDDVVTLGVYDYERLKKLLEVWK